MVRFGRVHRQHGNLRLLRCRPIGQRPWHFAAEILPTTLHAGLQVGTEEWKIWGKKKFKKILKNYSPNGEEIWQKCEIKKGGNPWRWGKEGMDLTKTKKSNI